MLVPGRGRDAAAPGTRLGVLYTLVFLYTAAMGLALPLIPQFLRLEFASGPLVVGLVAAVYGILQVAARVPLGAWTDRAGRRAAVRLAFVSTFLGGLFWVFAPSVLWVVPGQLLFAIASSAFWVSANAYVVDVLPAPEVPRAMTRYSIAMGLGFLVGPPLGGLADFVGFRPALAIFPAVGLLGALLATWLLDTGRSDEPAMPIGRAFVRAFTIMREPTLLYSAAGTFTFALLLGAISTFLPLYLRALAYTAVTVGIVFTLREAAALLLRIGLARWLTTERAASSMLAGIVVAAVATLALPLATTATHIGGLSVLAGLGIGIVIPANLTLIAAAAPPRERSLAMGIYGTALGLGVSVSPPVLGGVAERFGLEWAFVGAGVAALALAAWLATRLRSLPLATKEPLVVADERTE